MIRKTISILGALGIACVLAACSLTTEQQAAVDKAYDTTCSQEPGLYQTFVTIAVAKQVSDTTLRKAAAIHQTVVGLCETRPKDIASAAVQLANLYAQLVVISAQVERQPARVLVPS